MAIQMSILLIVIEVIVHTYIRKTSSGKSASSVQHICRDFDDFFI